MLTTPAAGRGWERDGAGGAPGAAAPVRAGAGGADALVEHQARTQIHVAHHGGAGGGQEPVTEPTQRWCVGSVPVGAGAVRHLEGPAGGVMGRLRCGRNTASDGRDLRFAGLVQHAGPHHSTAPMDSDGARGEMPAGRGWIGLKAETHGGPGRAGPRAKMRRWRARVPWVRWAVNRCAGP
jgi:hypothetical protein